jgi:hypothetical protein
MMKDYAHNTVLTKIAADESHSTTENLLNYITIFEQTEHGLPLLRQALFVTGNFIMTRNWYITEKIISLALIIWGGLLLYYSSRGILLLSDFVSSQDFSVWTTFKYYHLLFILPLATIIAGLLLLFDKRTGWTMALMTLLMNAFVFSIPKDKYTNNFDLNSSGFIVSMLFFSIVCLTSFFILLRKPLQIKYNPTKKTWLTIAVLTLFILLDKTLIYLLS